jgi:hypothetical protein
LKVAGAQRENLSFIILSTWIAQGHDTGDEVAVNNTALPLLGIDLRNVSGYYKGTCTPMFIAALFTMAKLWKQPRCPTADEWIKKCGIYTQWSFTQSQRRMKFCHSQVNGWKWRTSS